jgi:hypothetical protein
MAYEVTLDLPQVSGVVGLDVSTQNPGNAAPMPSMQEVQNDKKASGMETVEHAALTVAIGLGVLWLLGSTVLNNARL